MKGQASVGKRIIWAVSMVVLCTFTTFFASMFIGSAFPNLSIIYKGGIPVIIFVVLGIVSFAIQEYLLPGIKYLSVPEGVSKMLPVILVGLGILFMQFYYDENAGSEAVKSVYENFALNGRLFETTEFGFESIYQYVLNIVCILLGHTVFAVSIYNRCFVVLSVVFMYFALKNFTRKSLASILFTVFFFFGQQIFKLGVYPDAGLVYILLCAIFVFITSLVYHFRTSGKKIPAIIVTQTLATLAYAFLIWLEPNSIIFGILLVATFFSGYKRIDERIFYISSVMNTLIIVIGLVVVVALNPMRLLNYSFMFPSIQAVDYNTTALLILLLIGFLGVYNMWNQSILYIYPAFIGIYFLLVNPEFTSKITSELSLFMCFAVYAALSVEAMDEEAEFEEYKDKKITEKVLEESGVTEEIKEDSSANEIASIKVLNEKLNKVEQGFVPLTFQKPKRTEKKAVDYAYEPTPAQMKFDIEIAENDDFDI